MVKNGREREGKIRTNCGEGHDKKNPNKKQLFAQENKIKKKQQNN